MNAEILAAPILRRYAFSRALSELLFILVQDVHGIASARRVRLHRAQSPDVLYLSLGERE